jgi:hypothetical protein
MQGLLEGCSVGTSVRDQRAKKEPVNGSEIVLAIDGFFRGFFVLFSSVYFI